MVRPAGEEGKVAGRTGEGLVREGCKGVPLVSVYNTKIYNLVQKKHDRKVS